MSGRRVNGSKADAIRHIAGNFHPYESPDPSMSKTVLRDLIISSKYYKQEEAKELLEVITAERLETEQQQKLERQEQL
ncbi:hypothetical protein TNCV_54681 [Trichonephila clavipes]|nr:hypothetical protein TNCV_54681 [Trichonephila clavipes]